MKKNQKHHKFAFTYDNTASFDGTGAQIQRILAVYAICKRFNIPYFHSGISELIITPLDPFQTKLELQDYLDRVNEYFNLPSDVEMSDGRTLKQLQTLNKTTLLKIRILNMINLGRNHLIAVADPLQVINQTPDIYKLASKSLISPKPDSSKKKIVLHYRRGSNSLDILPGESKPRGLPNSWYLKVLRKYVDMYENLGIDFTIEILTDMPKSSFVYQPKDFQLSLWSYEPRFKNGKIEVIGEDIRHTVFSDFNGNLTVHHGGDPLRGLIAMGEADILIMSRSSYSYVGGLLNSGGTVVFPPEFDLGRLDSWVLESY
jgi:hypothetical protein